MEKSSKRRRLRVPSPAMVVACIALAIALSGVGYAAVTLPNGSVGTAQLKNGAVTTAKIASKAVGPGKVKDNSLTGAQINESTLQGVDAATVAGVGIDDIMLKTADHYDAYVAPGATWIDTDGQNRNHIARTANVNGPTQWCTLTGASTGNQASAYQSIHLPQGSRITELWAEYIDDAGANVANGTVSLVRQPLFSSGDGTYQEVFTATLTNLTGTNNGNVAVATDLSPPNFQEHYAIVDNSKYAYTLLAQPGTLSGVGFCGAKVVYELP